MWRRFSAGMRGRLPCPPAPAGACATTGVGRKGRASTGWASTRRTRTNPQTLMLTSSLCLVERLQRVVQDVVVGRSRTTQGRKVEFGQILLGSCGGGSRQSVGVPQHVGHAAERVGRIQDVRDVVFDRG